MTRLRAFFAIVLLLLALPLWRSADMVAFIWPHPLFQTLAMILWFMLFVAVPLKLLWPSTKPLAIFSGLLVLAGSVWFTGSLSHMATTDPTFKHCGPLTYTGFFYPLRSFSTFAVQDDLEARNQLCWLRKMITKIPRKFDSLHELETYEKLVMNRLLKPENKYRVALPMVAALYANTNMNWGEIMGGKRFYDSLHFWMKQYTVEISTREYSWWNCPYSNYIQFEYGLIERNWQTLIDNIVIQD